LTFRESDGDGFDRNGLKYRDDDVEFLNGKIFALSEGGDGAGRSHNGVVIEIGD
jgi:hypothetical protein